MNSWNAIGESLCDPPLIMFIIGTGITRESDEPIYLYRGIPSPFAAAFATARETARIAFAPRLLLFGVPSRSIMILSMVACSKTFIPISSGAIMPLTLATAFRTPLPKYLSGSPSRNSIASCSPVDAPEGTEATPTLPQSSTTSASTVGVPRESKISRALILLIFITSKINPQNHSKKSA